jgi:hypothetical protein
MKRDDDSLALLVQKLRWLRLPGMARLAPSLLEQAKKDNLTDLEILHRLCDEERASRIKSAVDRRIKDARFPELNTVDGFDFDFDPVRKKLRARYLAVPSPHQAASSSGSGLVFMHERSEGIHRASSKTLTARRCSAVSSGGSATVGRRPMPPVVVRTSVA